jgi:hypothetical protein
MSYTETQLDALRRALATGERRVTFADKTVEYRSVEELRAAIREVEAALAKEKAEAGTGRPMARQIRVTTGKGF